MVLALLKSGALKGRGCLFVDTPHNAYRLRMFLDTFGVRAALCHDAMPAKSREHAVQVSLPAGCEQLLLVPKLRCALPVTSVLSLSCPCAQTDHLLRTPAAETALNTQAGACTTGPSWRVLGTKALLQHRPVEAA